MSLCYILNKIFVPLSFHFVWQLCFSAFARWLMGADKVTKLQLCFFSNDSIFANSSRTTCLMWWSVTLNWTASQWPFAYIVLDGFCLPLSNISHRAAVLNHFTQRSKTIKMFSFGESWHLDYIFLWTTIKPVMNTWWGSGIPEKCLASLLKGQWRLLSHN